MTPKRKIRNALKALDQVVDLLLLLEHTRHSSRSDCLRCQVEPALTRAAEARCIVGLASLGKVEE